MSDAPARRIAVFTGGLSYTVRQGIVAIDEARPGLQWLVLLRETRRTPGGIWRSQILNIKRNGWRWITYQLGEIWGRLTSRARPHRPLPPTPGHELTGEAFAARPNVRIVRVADINGAEAQQALQGFGADLGLSLAAPILKRAVFALPRLGTINLHKGRLPDFRGMPPAFWELWHDQATVGCSIHGVDERLDTGPLVAESEVQRQRFSTVKGLQLELDDLAIGLTRDAALAMLDGTAIPRPQPAGKGATYRKPTLLQQAQLERKLAHPVQAPLAKKIAKQGLGLLAAGLSRVGVARLLAPRVVVLLYHRVADDARDNLTVGIEQFDQQMQWLATHCDVLPIEAVLAMDAVPRSGRPLVAVTFDDGYLDNYRHAAPILRRHGLPAAFFVSTGIVDSERAFPHDVRRKNPPLSKMSWDQLREMRAWGFTIGSHTVGHIDCAAEPEEVVRHELARSRDDLREQLGVTEPIFAYPYGGRQHMTPARLELVKQAGYVGCLSAYGGVNVGHVDRFNVVRLSLSWEFDPRSFQRLCLGWM